MYNTDNVIDRNLIPQSEGDHERSEETTCMHDNLSHMLNHMKNINNLLIFKLNLINSSGNLPHLFCKIKIGNLTNKCKALLDTGSGATFVSQRLINDLKIKTRQIKPVGVQTYDGNVQRTTTAVNLRNIFLYRAHQEHDDESTKGTSPPQRCAEESQSSSDGTTAEGTTPTDTSNGYKSTEPKRNQRRYRNKTLNYEIDRNLLCVLLVVLTFLQTTLVLLCRAVVSSDNSSRETVLSDYRS
jgi:hypothetical protein